MAGAYVLPFDPNGASQLISIPPPQGAGTIKFGRVFISFAYYSFGETRPAACEVAMAIVTTSGVARSERVVVVPSGRSAAIELEPGDGCVVISQLTQPTDGLYPIGCTMIEYQ